MNEIHSQIFDTQNEIVSAEAGSMISRIEESLPHNYNVFASIIFIVCFVIFISSKKEKEEEKLHAIVQVRTSVENGFNANENTFNGYLDFYTHSLKKAETIYTSLSSHSQHYTFIMDDEGNVIKRSHPQAGREHWEKDAKTHAQCKYKFLN